MRLSQVEFLLHFLFYPCDMQKSVPVGEICMQCKRCQLSVQSVSTLSDGFVFFTTESQTFHSSDSKERCFSRSETFEFE